MKIFEEPFCSTLQTELITRTCETEKKKLFVQKQCWNVVFNQKSRFKISKPISGTNCEILPQRFGLKLKSKRCFV